MSVLAIILSIIALTIAIYNMMRLYEHTAASRRYIIAGILIALITAALIIGIVVHAVYGNHHYSEGTCRMETGVFTDDNGVTYEVTENTDTPKDGDYTIRVIDRPDNTPKKGTMP